MKDFTSVMFLICASLLVFSSLAVVASKNPIRATLWLIVSFAPTAVLYLLLSAPFVGILQILVYAGAILMLFTFVIMMINPNPSDGEIPSHQGTAFNKSSMPHWYYLSGLLVTACVLVPMVYRFTSTLPTSSPTKVGFGSLASIAKLIYHDPLNNPLTLSFELISFLIMVGIIASLHFSRKQKKSYKN